MKNKTGGATVMYLHNIFNKRVKMNIHVYIQNTKAQRHLIYIMYLKQNMYLTFIVFFQHAKREIDHLKF